MSYPEPPAQHSNNAAGVSHHGSSGTEELISSRVLYYTLQHPLRVLQFPSEEKLNSAALMTDVQQSRYERRIMQVSNILVQYPLTIHTTLQHVQQPNPQYYATLYYTLVPAAPRFMHN